MDPKLFATTFAAIFLAELGDKTQLAVLSLSTEARAKWTIFFASALALAATSAIAVFAGATISRFVSPIWLKRIAGVMFLGMGALLLWKPGD